MSHAGQSRHQNCYFFHGPVYAVVPYLQTFLPGRNAVQVAEQDTLDHEFEQMDSPVGPNQLRHALAEPVVLPGRQVTQRALYEIDQGQP